MQRGAEYPSALARVVGATVDGLGGRRVRVEADVAPVLPGFCLVGLPGASLRESRERIGRALHNSGFVWPEGRITVSLAPADLRKDGAAMDLPIAVAILLASGQVARAGAAQMRRTLFVGELALDGALRPTRGVVAMALDARRLGIETVVVATAQVPELADVTGVRIEGLDHLRDLPRLLPALECGSPPEPQHRERAVAGDGHEGLARPAAALGRVRGQARALRALLAAAAGGHHLMLQGPPGCGKTLIARTLGELLPPLRGGPALEHRRICSCAGLPSPPPGPVAVPVRAPHHSTTAAGLLGGGRPVRPGEITLAHRGILLLDEISEFPARTLDRLREPLSDGVVRMVRGDERVDLPARLQLVATANPCPCGWYGSALDRCRCAPSALSRYRGRLSGPLRDRIDLWVEMDREPAARYFDDSGSEGLRPVIQRARELRSALLEPSGPESLARELDAEARDFVAGLADRTGSSVRGLNSAIRVARTLAALDGVERVSADALAEAFTFRPVS